MNVSDILNDIGLLGVGLENPTSEDQAVFLKYLNLAHFDLFRKTAALNPKVIVLHQTVNANNGVLDPLAFYPFLVKKVYVVQQNWLLNPISIDVIQKDDPSISKVETRPQYWYYYNNTLNIYPLYTGQIGVFYIPDPISLEADTYEINIPYPVAFHPILIDGACYYLFQGEGAFKDALKMQTALARWEQGKTELMSYLTTLAGQSYYSTFSRV